MRDFVLWYNHEHHHSGIALLTPADVHFGRTEERRDSRRSVLHAAYAAHPERFVGGAPEPLELMSAVFITPAGSATLRNITTSGWHQSH